MGGSVGDLRELAGFLAKMAGLLIDGTFQRSPPGNPGSCNMNTNSAFEGHLMGTPPHQPVVISLRCHAEGLLETGEGTYHAT